MTLVTCGADGSTNAEIVEQINTNTTKSIFPADTMTDLLAVDKSIYKSVNVKGYHTENDGGGGLFNWDSTIDKSTANGITIVDPDQTLATQGDGVGNGCWIRQTYSKEDTGTVTNYSIPTDFTDLQEALDILSERHKTSGAKVNINIETGHALTSGFRIENIDLSYITITSTDAIVNLSGSFTPVSNTDLDAGVPRTPEIAFLAVRAKMPKWEILADLSGYAALITGYELDHGSDGIIAPACGVINIGGTGTNARISTSSRLHSYQAVFSGSGGIGLSATVNARISCAEGDFSNCAVTGLDVSRGSMVYANSSDFSGCAEGVYVRRSWLSCQIGNFSNCTSVAIWAALGSRIASQGSVFDGANKDVQIGEGSLVDVSEGTKSASKLIPSDSVRSTTTGTRVMESFNSIHGAGFVTNTDSASGHPEVLTQYSAVAVDHGDNVAVTASSYHTIVDLTGEDTVFSGSIYGADLGIRITIDGVVVLNDLSRDRGEDNVGNTYSVINIPPCKSTTSLKIELYNIAAVSKNIGWKIYRS